MYIFLLVALLAAGAYLTFKGFRNQKHSLILCGKAGIVTTLLFFALLSFWGEMLWFESVGYAGRFWRMVAAKGGTAFGASVITFLAVYFLTGRSRLLTKSGRAISAVGGALIGGIIGYESWDELLLFLNGSPTGVTEPILGRDTSFYLFVLPFYDRIYWLLLWTLGSSLLLIFFAPVLARRLEWMRPGYGGVEPVLRASSFLLPTALLGVVLAWGRILGIYHLLYSEWGVVAGPGWTDTRIRVPALWITAVVTLLLALVPAIPPLRRILPGKLPGLSDPLLQSTAKAWMGIGLIWAFALILVPTLVQWLVVEPNEITFEKPFIEHNIKFTRHGFRLHDVEERQFPATEILSRQTLEDNQHLLSEVRLWDWRALDAVYKQFQEIRLYFEFHDVDMDRYRVGDEYRQMMVSARELEQANLPSQSRTFVNQRFKYTHGYGLAMATVSDFTENGLPKLLVKDIPPKTETPELEITHPQIYYGELSTEPVVVNTKEQEFDYPSGDENVYTTYSGTGGVRLGNLWRKFVYGWKFDGTRFFFSTYMTPETRVMFHRQIRERVTSVAPFLKFDEDPYIVVSEGRLYWFIDGYTTSSYYPYSEPFVDGGAANYLNGVNYVRNSVKAVISAYDGEVRLYVFEPDDPLVRAWRGAFPNLFFDREEMPEALQAHVRYPEDFLLVQGLVYAKYHMSDPEVFYNQEDLWVRATEKYYANIQPLDPYYVMWQLPGKTEAEFVLMLPFTPKNRQVLIGWIAGMCDAENYGRFLAYKFPKEKRVLGPQQVETKIDQDRFLSGQLTLWDQRGSKVIRGNVLAIPIEDTLLYVEPIYLQAETAAYPELRVVVVMHGDNMSYGDTFQDALEGLFQGSPVGAVERNLTGQLSVEEIASNAKEAFENYLSHLGARRFAEASSALERLEDSLAQLVEAAAVAGNQSESPR